MDARNARLIYARLIVLINIMSNLVPNLSLGPLMTLVPPIGTDLYDPNLRVLAP